jgi:pleckstrin homology-like domain family B
VIEEERKRVQALKRRVQDEVRAQWEERRQREGNCNSLNSVGSEDSTSSDMPTERSVHFFYINLFYFQGTN